jgi:uncharacterized protein
MIIEKISQETAKRLMLNAQLLDGTTNLSKGKKGVLEIMERLGYVQIDSLSVVKRAHHHVLWTRMRDYNESMLDDLLAKDRKVFEYWGHAVCYLPMTDYRFYLPRMRNFSDPKTSWGKKRLHMAGHLMQPILDTIRDEGPKSSKDFTPQKGEPVVTGDSFLPQLVRIALDLLFWRGDLMISERKSFRKVFDLKERVLPKNTDTTYPNDDELGTFFVRRSLSALGIVTEKEILSFMQPEGMRDSDIRATSNGVIKRELDKQLKLGQVVQVEINEIPGVIHYTYAESLDKIKKIMDLEPQVTFLSPFDNLVIRRERIKRLFDFEYTIECYVPAAKRKYGYFVLPVLWKDQLVARFDPKTDKKTKTLLVQNLVYEPGFNDKNQFEHTFNAELETFATFNNCKMIKKIRTQSRDGTIVNK